MPSATVDDVGAGRLADVRDLVDEADPRHRGTAFAASLIISADGDVAADDGRLDAVVQRSTTVAVRLVERADDDAIGVHEVVDGRSLGE